MIRETGFPTAGHPAASAAQQQCYFSLLSQTGVPFVYFEAFDQFTKYEELDGYVVGPHWGLFDQDRNEKEVHPDSEALSCSQTTCPGCQGVLYTMRDVCYEEQYGASRIGLDCYKVGIGDRHYAVSDCDFEYHEGHAGGAGETLEIVGCGDAVYMQWAFGRLQSISVRAGWEGETGRGLGIGDSIEVFQQLYPEARQRTKGLCEPDVTTIWTAGHLKVNVNEQGALDMMAVDSDDHSTEDGDAAVSWFAPRHWP